MKLTITITCHVDDLAQVLDALSVRYSIDDVVYTDESTLYVTVAEVSLTLLD